MAFIDDFAAAIAYAEGFYVSGSRPARDNNPGDLTVDTTGKAVATDGPFMVYATIADGWDALKRQIELMLSGASAYYDPSMTISEIAAKYTATDPEAWAANVASQLGTTVDSTLSALEALYESLPAGSPALVAIVVFGAVWLFRKAFLR